jgi:tetratricopeptide (TPR) repeat protein
MRSLALCIFLGLSAASAQNPPSQTAPKADRLRSLITRAEAAEQQNRLDEAISLYGEILRIRPGWASAELNLGLVYHSRAEYAKAIQSLTNALTHNPGLHSALLFRGASYYHTGRYSDAVRDLKNYLRTDASSTEALSYLGNAQLAKHDPAEAALAYAPLARVSNDPSAYFQLSDAYIQLARSVMERLAGEDAEMYKRRIIAADASTQVGPCELPSDAELTRVRCAADRFEFETATATLIELLRRTDITQESIFNSVGACRRLARAAVAKVVSLAPESTWAALLRAQAAEQSGDIDKMEKEYELAVAAPGAGLESYVRFGQFESKHGRYDRALTLYERALTLEPANPRVMGLIGEVHALQDRPGRAAPYLETALHANPHETQTRLYLAQSLIRLKRSAEALRILEAAPEDPDGRVHYLLGRTYQQQGEPQKARKAMDESRRLRRDPTK